MLKTRCLLVLRFVWLPMLLGLCLAVPLSLTSDGAVLISLMVVYLGVFCFMFIKRARKYAESHVLSATLTISIGAFICFVVSSLICDPHSGVAALNVMLYLSVLFTSFLAFLACSIALEAFRLMRKELEKHKKKEE